MSTRTLYIGNDHLIQVNGLKDQDGNLLTSATVEATLTDKDGNTVTNGGPITLSHQGSGDYEGTLDKDVDIDALDFYYLEITAVSGAGDAKWRLDVRARHRE